MTSIGVCNLYSLLEKSPRSLSGRTRLKQAIATVLLAAILNVSFFFKNPKAICKTSRNSINRMLDIDYLNGLVAIVHFSLTYLLPLVLLLLFNTALVYLLILYRRNRFHINRAIEFQVSSNRSSVSENNFCRSRCGSVSQIRRVRQLKNTRKRAQLVSRSTVNFALMVLVITLVHLFLESPGIALKLFVLTGGEKVTCTDSWLVLASCACTVLVFMHCCIDWCAILLAILEYSNKFK